MMTLSKTQGNIDLLNLGVTGKRIMFNAEIRKVKITNFLNYNRSRNISLDFLKEFKLFSERNKDLPSLDVYFYFILKNKRLFLGKP